jgi:thiamine-phosphate pyrophosphorylase
MDAKLIAWARAVKARRRSAAVRPLWLFTDRRRLADPCAAAASLPRGLAGVVLRHDDDPDRAALGRALARICRGRRLQLVVAGDTRLAVALRAGVHLRRGQWPGPLRRRRGLVSSSAHSRAELTRARRAGAHLVFLSPTFASLSHVGAPGLGVVRWARLAQMADLPVLAVGGVTGRLARRLPRYCGGAGAIGALVA